MLVVLAQVALAEGVAVETFSEALAVELQAARFLA